MAASVGLSSRAGRTRGWSTSWSITRSLTDSFQDSHNREQIANHGVGTTAKNIIYTYWDLYRNVNSSKCTAMLSHTSTHTHTHARGHTSIDTHPWTNDGTYIAVVNATDELWSPDRDHPTDWPAEYTHWRQACWSGYRCDHGCDGQLRQVFMTALLCSRASVGFRLWLHCRIYASRRYPSVDPITRRKYTVNLPRPQYSLLTYYFLTSTLWFSITQPLNIWWFFECASINRWRTIRFEYN